MKLATTKPAPTCGKHNCIREPGHAPPHRNRFYEWKDGKEFQPTKLPGAYTAPPKDRGAQ